MSRSEPNLKRNLVRYSAFSLWEALRVDNSLTPADRPLDLGFFTPVLTQPYPNTNRGDISALSRICWTTLLLLGSSITFKYNLPKPPQITNDIDNV